ncbi:MAG: RNA methyltransferase [Planctomycetaceae bacterium]|nr:RNA methyltransferase [Planctomycetaceae bacterium]
MHDYFAVSAQGIEPATAAELTRLGASDVRPVSGGVHFSAELETLFRACLWLRTASRILRPLREFAAGTAEMLYSQTRRVRWEDYLDPTKTLAVHATIEGSSARRKGGKPTASRPQQGIHHSMFAALKIKDAIVDRLRREQGARPNVDRHDPDLLVNAHFSGGRCSLSLDAVGTSLHERGYRTESAPAPLKETLAAAIIELIGWDVSVPLYDPLCGSGTLLIEAAMKSLRIAPGLSRARFACQRWPDYDGALWQSVCDVARREQLAATPAPLVGSDADAAVVGTAQIHAGRAKVEGAIRFFVQSVDEAQPPGDLPAGVPGVIVTNPPYGERLGDEVELEGLYRRLGQVLSERFVGWTAWVLAGNLSLARHIGLTATQKLKLFNGPIPCRLLRFDL